MTERFNYAEKAKRLRELTHEMRMSHDCIYKQKNIMLDNYVQSLQKLYQSYSPEAFSGLSGIFF